MDLELNNGSYNYVKFQKFSFHLAYVILEGYETRVLKVIFNFLLEIKDLNIIENYFIHCKSCCFKYN